MTMLRFEAVNPCFFPHESGALLLSFAKKWKTSRLGR